jgi:hypothetical protein
VGSTHRSSATAGRAFTGTPSASTITRNNPPPRSVAENVSGSDPVHVLSVLAAPPTDCTTGANRSRIVTVEALSQRYETSEMGEP